MTARGLRLSGDEVASLGILVARAIVVRGQADVAWGDRVIAPWTPHSECVAPRQVRPGSLVSVGCFSSTVVGWNAARVVDVRLAGASVLAPASRAKLWSMRETFTAPTTAGDYAIEVDWETSFPGIGDGGNTGALARQQHVTRAALRVVDEPERVNLTSDPGRNLADDARFNLRLIIEPIGERDRVTVVVWAPDSVAFNGRWEISIDGAWTPLADQVTSLFLFSHRLVPHPIDG
ncbi:MAG: hypothetical protein SGJ09_17395 [Phycisphaerae bacterium]|nr:hypothetical protein [Phycisphaerae bacterium]